MIAIHGSRALTTTREEYEKLLTHPASISGTFDPALGTWPGEVCFHGLMFAVRAVNECGL